MADKQISDLTSASGLTDGSLFVLEQAGAAMKANWGMMKNYISPGVAPQYSSSATYNVGDYVIYNDQLYRCTTAITTAETWTAAHWTAAVLGDDVGDLKSAFNQLCVHNYLLGVLNKSPTGNSGIAITYDNGSYTLSGVATANNSINLYVNANSFPNGMKSGQSYVLDCSGIGPNCSFVLFAMVSSSWTQLIAVNEGVGERRAFTIPSNATGLLARISFSAGAPLDTTFYPIVCNDGEYSNTDLYTMLDSLLVGKIIEDGSDLNDYRDTGIYLLAEGRTVLHSPGIGVLEVVKSSSSGVGIQRFTNISAHEILVRRFVGSSFTEWNCYKRTSVPSTELKIAMFGDSITYGRDGASTGQVGLTIPKIVEMSNRFRTTNFGVGSMGWISTQYISKTALDKIQDTDLSGFNVITYMYGTNDTQETLGEYTDITDNTIMGRIYTVMKYVAETYPTITQVLIGVPNTTNFKNTEYGGFPSYDWTVPMYVPNKTKKDLNDQMKLFAEKYHLPFIDLSQSSISSFNITSFLPDNTHPNQAGYMALGGYIKGQLEVILGS